MKEINIRDIKESAVGMINDGWALVSAGNELSWNTMTVSWGALGELWGKDVAFVFIRPQRYTYEFFEREELFTVSFFAEEHREILKICGAKSGRDCNKAQLTGLKAEFSQGAPCFEQAQYTLVCRKVAAQDLDPAGFIDENIEKNYANKDYHRMYVGEILKVLKKV